MGQHAYVWRRWARRLGAASIGARRRRPAFESFSSLPRPARSAAAAPGLSKCTTTPLKLRQSSQRWAVAASSPRASRSTSLEKASAEASDPARRHPRGPPTRTHASSGEHKRAQQQKNDASQQTTPSISQAHPNARTAHPSHTTTPGRTHRGLVDGRPATDCSKPSCRKQSVCRRHQRQNRQPRHQEAAHNLIRDGRRRAHGGAEPAPTEHDARAS